MSKTGNLALVVGRTPLADLAAALANLEESLAAAVMWLTEIAQVRTADLQLGEDSRGFGYADWRGAFRGEYFAAERRWQFYCPIWHGGQAVKALAWAHRATGKTAWLTASRAGADFILRHQLTDGPDAGMILAFEDDPAKLNTSAVLEAVDGLFVLGRITGETSYTDAATRAVRWCVEHAWLQGQGLLLDQYDPQARRFSDRPFLTKDGGSGRPLADDAAQLTAFHACGDQRYKECFYDVAERLLADENPPGNWGDYGPSRGGECHPRMAFWWGLPMLAAWHDSGEQRYLDAAVRCGTWYRKAQRSDGGMFRYTNEQFNTACFGQATSGSMCAAIMWLDLYEATGQTHWLEPVRAALEFGMSVQFTRPTDPNLKGCILEKVFPPGGTDRSPYLIRDLGTIFFVQAAAKLLLAARGDRLYSTLRKA